MQEVSAGYRHPRPPGCPHRVYETMMATWLQDKWQRPTFKQLLRQFDGMLQDELKASGMVNHRSSQSSTRSAKPPVSPRGTLRGKSLRQQAVADVARRSEAGSSLVAVTSATTLSELSEGGNAAERITNNYRLSDMAISENAAEAEDASKIPASELAFEKAAQQHDEEEAFGGGSEYATLHSDAATVSSSFPADVILLVDDRPWQPMARRASSSIV